MVSSIPLLFFTFPLSSIYCLKFSMIIGDLLCAREVYKLTKGKLFGVALWLFNPLSLWLTAYENRLDVFIAYFLLLSIQSNKKWFSTFLSSGIKIPYILLEIVPMIMFSDFRAFSVLVLTLLCVEIFELRTGNLLWRSFNNLLLHEPRDLAITYLLGISMKNSLITYALILITSTLLMFLFRKRLNYITALTLFSTVFILFMPILHVWYLYPLVPLWIVLIAKRFNSITIET